MSWFTRWKVNAGGDRFTGTYGSNPDIAPLPVQVFGAAGANPTVIATSPAGGSTDGGPAWTPVRANKSSADLSAISDLTAAPTAGQKIVIDDLWVSVDTAMRVDISEETSGT